MRALFDVNVLLALFDSNHIHHARASSWWRICRDDGWASCPLTQNGFIRVISGPQYSRPCSSAEAIALIRAQTEQPGHAFWPDDISLLDPMLFDRDRILGSKQITDIYLLALAVKHGGRLATLDRRVPMGAVRDAEPRHLVVL